MYVGLEVNNTTIQFIDDVIDIIISVVFKLIQHSHILSFLVLNSMCFHIEKGTFLRATMMDSALDGKPYQLFSYQKSPKKAHTNHDKQAEVKNQTEILVCIVFKSILSSILIST